MIEINSNWPEEKPEPTRESTASSFDLNIDFLNIFTADDISAAMFAFNDKVKTFRREPELIIDVDWSQLPINPDIRKGIMRRMKALVEYKPTGQIRKIIIRGTKAEYEAAAEIEANVLSSGVKWESTD